MRSLQRIQVTARVLVRDKVFVEFGHPRLVLHIVRRDNKLKFDEKSFI